MIPCTNSEVGPPDENLGSLSRPGKLYTDKEYRQSVAGTRGFNILRNMNVDNPSFKVIARVEQTHYPISDDTMLSIITRRRLLQPFTSSNSNDIFMALPE